MSALPMLALRHSGVELRDGDWWRFQWIHQNVLEDPPVVEMVKRDNARQIAHDGSVPAEEVVHVLFSRDELRAAYEAYKTPLSEPFDDLTPRNTAALVGYWQPPTCPACGARMRSGVAFLCGGPAGGGRLRLPATCPSRECAKARDAAAIAAAIERGVIDP